jgi:adenylylsulfate reductase subunit A
MLDEFEGKGPIYMRTEEAIQKIAEQFKDDPAAYKKKMKELEAEAWEDFLDMTISQAILWAGTDVQPEEKSSEIAAAEPYFIGSHSGASGAWVSGPKDLQSAESASEYCWGYDYMSTVKGLFCAGDASGASSHKFSSGSHAEGRAAGKSIVKFVVENNTQPNVDAGQVEALKTKVLKPLDLFAAEAKKSSDPDINPAFMKPKMFMFRLQKIMDEYAAGVSAGFKTNKPKLDRALELLNWLKEDSEKLAAEDLHELMRCHENIQRMYQAEAHVRTILFREETRWPGYYFRNDFPTINEDDWKVFVNATYKDGNWEMKKVPVLSIVD